MRADAQRSYDRILEVAGDVFVEQGADASMNEIAKRAGVGPGTLYRHFPSRDHLYDVLLKDWVDQIQLAADKAAASELPPREVLVAWFEAIVAHITVHRGGPARLMAALGRPESPMVGKCEALVRANSTVLSRLAERGALRRDVDTTQVCRVVGGVASVADGSQLAAAARRPLLEIVADGLVR